MTSISDRNEIHYTNLILILLKYVTQPLYRTFSANAVIFSENPSVQRRSNSNKAKYQEIRNRVVQWGKNVRCFGSRDCNELLEKPLYGFRWEKSGKDAKLPCFLGFLYTGILSRSFSAKMLPLQQFLTLAMGWVVVFIKYMVKF